MKSKRNFLKRGLAAVAVALFIMLIWLSSIPAPVSANASYEPCTVKYYTVNAVVNKDRTIDFEEEICFTMNTTKYSFYRSLPLEGDRYFHIEAEGVGQDDFSYDVADNPDVDGFMDINCYGDLSAGNTLTYRFRYTMEVAERSSDSMSIDFIGAGWPITLRNVNVHIQFPDSLKDYTVYSGGYGSSGNDYVTVSETADKTVLKLSATELPLSYNSSYSETMAAGVTLQFTFQEGVLDDYLSTRITPTIFVVLGVCAVCILAAVLGLWVCRKKPMLIPIVTFKPPENMDPLRMGKFIDGAVDNEDITSMIFYFASKGYLMIALDGEEPVLTRTAVIPDDAPAYQKTLFNGLFKRGDRVMVSSLANRYYEYIDSAKVQLTTKDIPRYEKKSFGVSLLVALLSFAVFFFSPLLIGISFVGGGYLYTLGVTMLFPVLVIFLLGYVKETRKHRGNNKKGFLNFIVGIVMVVGGFMSYLSGSHLLTGVEKTILLVVGYTLAWLAPRALTSTEKYNDILCHVVGFKEFITVTEKDKIKFMLEENPELFYDILPYAQVLGVTDEWENKFKGITLTPPSWYAGSYLDYWMMRSCMRRAAVSMITRPQSSGGTVGRSGGGGGFGGFSGGGRGGGGGGFR